MAKKDWIVAGINNPDFTNDDFANIADMSVSNTQFLSKEDYMKSDFIKNNPLFADANGKFSESKFTDYYQRRARDFGEFQQGEFSKGPTLDMFDIDRTLDSKVTNNGFSISRGINPDRQAIGIEGVNKWSDPEFSRREIAKQNKVFNTAKGEFEDYSVNDHTLVTNPIEWIKDQFRDPLVLATYDEDGEHLDPFTGMMKEHHKGDAKLNSKGTYYYETLGGRSVIGKDVLSTLDTLTVDGQGLNKYDFFDSNDIQKSVAGTIAKNVVSLLPLFCGPVIGSIYSGALVAREFSKSLPMLYGMLTAYSESETPKWMNTLAAAAQRGTSSTSDYAGENTFAFENFGNLMADVALQWGQQKFVAQGVNWIKGTPDYMANAQRNAKALYDAKKATLGESEELWNVCLNKFLPEAEKMAAKTGELGRDLSLAYMAIVSNTDVYESALEHGTTKKEAAAIAFGSTLGMFAVDKYAHLGEIFFDEATPNYVKQARKALKNEIAEAQQAFAGIRNSAAPTRNKFMAYMNKGVEIGKRLTTNFWEDLKYHSLSMSGKMLGEGLEEVSEELVADFSKSLYELAGDFGFDTSVRNIGAWDNAFERYTMSFLGGAAGGGIFYGKEVWDKRQFHKPKLNEDIATLIRNGHVDALREQLQVMRSENKTGSESLSASEYTTDDQGNRVWRTTDNKKQSQAEAISNLVLDRINSIEEVITGNRVGLSDDELFENMVLSEKRYNRFKNISQITNYYQNFAHTLDKLVNAELNYKRALDTMEGVAEGGTPIPNDTALSHLSDDKKQQREDNLNSLRQDIDSARTAVSDYLSGDNSLEYTRMLNFAMDPQIHTAFLDVSKEDYFRTKFPNKTPEQITPEEFFQFEMVDWPKYVQEQLKVKLADAWSKFKNFEQIVNPHLSAVETESATYKQWLRDFSNLEQSGFFDLKKLAENHKQEKDKLDTETDDEYQYWNKKKIDPTTQLEETDEQFAQRRLNRLRAIDQYNEQQDKLWVDRIDAELQRVNYRVDPLTARKIKSYLPMSNRLRETLLRKLTYNPVGSNRQYDGMLINLKADLSNLDEIKNEIRASLESKTADALTNLARSLSNIEIEDINGIPMAMADFCADGSIPDAVTIRDLLEDPDIETTLGSIDPNSIPVLQQWANDLKAFNIPALLDVSIVTAANSTAYVDQALQTPEFAAFIDREFSPIENQINGVVAEYSRSPLVQLQNKLQSDIVNPIGDLISRVATANNDVVPDLENILNTIQSEYDNMTDVNQLVLDDTQRANLEKAMSYMELLQVYLTAASTIPNTVDPVGHNRTANAFAETHQDKLRKPWQKLPEIDSDYAMMYMQSLNAYAKQIQNWIDLSDNNQGNKIRKIALMDQFFNKALWGALSSVTRKFSFNNKDYNLLEGLDSIDTTLLNTPRAQEALYKLERVLYKNVQQIAADNNLTIAELIKTSGILDTLMSGLSTIDNKLDSQIGVSDSTDTITDMDKVQYIAAILSEDPAVFFKHLQQRVSGNADIAPITSQEFAARLAHASMTQTFRDIMEYAYSKSANQDTPYLSNTTLLFGVAGAGKTQVVLNSIDSTLKDKTVWVAGPTSTQAKTLKDSLGRNDSMDFRSLMIKILGENQWNSIEASINRDPSINPQAPANQVFSIKKGKDDLMKVKLDLSKIQFENVSEVPAAIYIDEATHLSTVQAMIIDAYAKSVGAQVFMAGDTTQRGYMNHALGIGNIDEGAVWAAKAPKLTLSLRDNNLQKFQNQEAVRTLLGQLNHLRLNAPDADYKGFFESAKNLAKAIDFKIYNKDELNGDLITRDLSQDLLAKLKAAKDAGKSIAFIGDSMSPRIAQLQNAGINLTTDEILSLGKMQGQEFDLVVIDQDFTVPDDIIDMRNFLQDLYTLMTRAKQASIFIDRGLTQIIGPGTQVQNKSKAPSITAGIEQLRTSKLDILNSLDLSMLNGQPNPAAQNQQPNQQQNQQNNQNQNQNNQQGNQNQNNQQPSGGNQNQDLDFTDPTQRTQTQEVQNIIDNLLNSDASEQNDLATGQTTLDAGNFMVECYGDSMYLEVEEGQERTYVDSKGKQRKVRDWKVTMPTAPDAELRNLQAVAPNETASTYKEKLALQRKMFQVRSAILFDHEWNSQINRHSLPDFISQYFNRDDWENGTYELEFRKVRASDVLPVWGSSENFTPGMEYGGQRLIANIIYKVKNKQGQICKFDIAGINDPKTLLSKKDEIKAGILNRINNPKTTADTKAKLQDLYDHWDARSDRYKQWFNTKADEFALSGQATMSIDVTSAVKKSKYTMLKKRKGAPIRLGGLVDIDNIDVNTKLESLREVNPDKVFSSIYTFTGNEKDFNNLDQSIAGRAVVFVSSDCLLKPEDLLHTYLEQKKNPDSNTPVVRMIILDPVGVSFHDMIDPDYMTKVAQAAGGQKVPFRKNFMGLQMFTSMWNHRAALLKFNTALADWMTTNNLNPDKVKAITEAQYKKFRGESDAAVQSFLQAAGLDMSALDLLEKFNNETLKDIPTYRLGYSDNSKGFHIQRFNVQNSTAYNTPEANLLVVTADKATQFYKMLNSVLNVIAPGSNVSNLVGSNTMGLTLYKTDAQGNRTEWQADEFIDLNEANHRRSLSGLLSKPQGAGSTNQLMQITDPITNTELAFAEGDVWSAIPHFLGVYTRSIAFHQYNNTTGGAASNQTHYAKVKYLNPVTGQDETIYPDFAEFFGADGILKGPNDTGMHDMFDLIFHGTTQDFKKPAVDQNGNRVKVVQLDDAYFKNGFYIHPEISRKTDSDGNIEGVRGSNGEVTFYEIATPDMYFFSDVDIRPAGIQLSLEELLNIDNNRQPTPPSPQPQNQQQGPAPSPAPSQPAYTDNQKQVREAAQLIAPDTNLDDLAACAEVFNRMSDTGFWSDLKKGIKSPTDMLASKFQYDAGTDSFITFKEYLQKIYPGGDIFVDSATNRITIKQQGMTYVADPEQGKIVETNDNSARNAEEAPNVFDQAYGETTVGKAFEDTLKNMDLAQTVLDNLADDISNGVQFVSGLKGRTNPVVTVNQTAILEAMNNVLAEFGNLKRDVVANKWDMSKSFEELANWANTFDPDSLESAVLSTIQWGDESSDLFDTLFNQC